MTSPLNREVDAGGRYRWSRPLTINSGADPDAIDARLLVSNTDTGALLFNVPATVDVEGDPPTGTITSDWVTLPDDLTATRITVAFDGDDALGDLLHREELYRVKPATVRRPAP